MPIFRSFLCLDLTWLLRAWALRCWLYWIVPAVCSINLAEARPPSHQERTSEPTAVWTWQTVSSRFFFPQLFPDGCQKQVTDARKNQMAFESEVASPFPLVEADLLFLILETTFDSPTRKTDQQERCDRSLRRCVADEVFHFVRVDQVASDDQMQSYAGKVVFVFDRDHRVLRLPHERTFLAVLDVVAHPRRSHQNVSQTGAFRGNQCSMRPVFVFPSNFLAKCLA